MNKSEKFTHFLKNFKFKFEVQDEDERQMQGKLREALLFNQQKHLYSSGQVTQNFLHKYTNVRH